MPETSSDTAAPEGKDHTHIQADPPKTMDLSADSTNPSFGAVAPAGSVPGYPFLSPPQAADEIGRLGEYRVLQKLGEGGMGFVFRGHDPALNRHVALKVMRPEVAAKPQAADRFLREGRAAAGLKSDHIITIYQVGRANGVPFLAMEFLEGLPLDAWIRGQKKAVPLPHALRIVRDTLRGLASAHDKGLIHRDIKPANLWIEKGTGRIKVLDFGLTRSSDADAQLTQEGAVVGTPAYMAPEQASGKPVDPRADLFSVGTIFYQLLAGKNPFARGNLMETLGAVGFDTQPPVTTVRPDVPKEYADFLDRLLAKDPNSRPANAKAALTELVALEKKLQDATKTVAPSGAVPVVAVPLPDAPPPVWNELTDADGVGPRSSPAAADAPAKPPAQKKLLIGGGLFAFLVVLGGIIIVITNKDGTKTTVEVPDGAKVEVKDGGKTVASVGPKKVDPPKLGPPDGDGWTPVAADEVDLLALDEKAATTPPNLVPWNKRDGRWISTPRERTFTAVVLPFKSEGAYSLALDITLDAGNDFLGINLPVGPKGGVCFEINGLKGKVWEFLDIKGFEDHSPKNPTYTVKQPVAIGKQMKLTLTVKPQGDQVTLVAAVEGHDEIRWKGPASDLSLPTYQNFPAGQLSLISYECQWTVHALKYKKLDGTAYTRASDGWTAVAADELDLLTLDEKAAATPPGLSPWSRHAGKWSSVKTEGYSAVVLPFKADGSYALTVELVCDDVSNFFGVALPVGPRGALFHFNGFDGTVAEFLSIRGMRGANPDNPTLRRTTPVVVGQRAKMTLTVKRAAGQATLVAAVEGRDEIRWTGPEADLSLPGDFVLPEGQVSLISRACGWTVHALRYKTIDGTAYTRAAPAANADRAAAEFVLGKGGQVRIGETFHYAVNTLPAGAFQVDWVGTSDEAKPTTTDADLDVLRPLAGLKNLYVYGPVTDAGLARLSEFEHAREWPQLGILHSRVSDDGLKVVPRLVGLKQLTLAHAPAFTGAGLAYLKGTGLNSIGLERTGIRDAALVHLKQLPDLRQVWIPDTKITDAGLEVLAEIKSLQLLNVKKTKVTAVGVKTFRAALPECKVESDFDDK